MKCQKAAATVYNSTVPAWGEGRAGESGIHQSGVTLHYLSRGKLGTERESERQEGGHVQF